jgi:hypothetical protein
VRLVWVSSGVIVLAEPKQEFRRDGCQRAPKSGQGGAPGNRPAGREGSRVVRWGFSPGGVDDGEPDQHFRETIDFGTARARRLKSANCQARSCSSRRKWGSITASTAVSAGPCSAAGIRSPIATMGTANAGCSSA